LNELVLKELTQEYVIYLYRTETEGSYGEIHMNIGDENATVVSFPDEDSGWGYYAYKAAKAVESCVKEHAEDRNFPSKFIQAWY